MTLRCFAAVVAMLAAVPTIRAEASTTHRQAAEDLFRAMNIDKQMENALDQTLAMSIKQQPGLDPYKEVMRKFFAKHISYEALKDDLVKIYTDEFSEDELRQILAFYKTPAGQKLVEKSPALLGKCMKLGMDRVSKNENELRQMIDAEVKKRQEKQDKK